MTNWILASSVLVVVILLIRKLFGEKLAPGLQYGLWLLVLVRLLIPVSFGGSAYSLAAFADRAVAWAEEKTASGEVESYIYEVETMSIEGEDAKFSPPDAVNVVDHTYISHDEETLIDRVLYEYRKYAAFYLIWLIGMAVTGGIFLLSNAFFRICIYSDREEIEEEELEKRYLSSEIPVYVTRFAATPCLAGFRKPGVYIPRQIWERNVQEEAEDNGKNRELDAMIRHENVHYAHGDQLWGLLRLLCLVLHWYNPLVWAAALASRQDAELFCDAGTVRKLGEENRYEYGRVLLRMTAKEDGCAGRLPDSLRHAGLCNTEMADTKKHMERRIKRLSGPTKKSTAAIVPALLFVLVAFGYLFLGKEGQTGVFWNVSAGNHAGQEEVMISLSDPPDGKLSDEVFLSDSPDGKLSDEVFLSDLPDGKLLDEALSSGEAAESFFPGEEEVEEVRKKALAGMDEEEIDAFTTYVKNYHNWLESELIYGDLESRLSDKNSMSWNYFDQTGEIQTGWALEGDPESDAKTGREIYEYMRQKYPEFGDVSLDELGEMYGTPVYADNPYGSEVVIERVRELTTSAGNEIFLLDVENLCDTLQMARDTHEVEHVIRAHEILHDMEYFLLRYSPRDVAPYTLDKSLSGRYYGALEVWEAWRDGML